MRQGSSGTSVWWVVKTDRQDAYLVYPGFAAPGGEHAAFAITLPARWRCSAAPANRIRTQLGGLPLSVTPMICRGDLALLRPLEILSSNAALGIHGSVPDTFLASLSTDRRSRLALVISQHQKTNPR
ncbi:uncharacterized protein TrAFT101_000481 [Trichoderma asperellum]|uniref:uncharacterized protein n=1 Tax=Trichoderma asperellum TaxID=101201 RepID=UPI003321E0E7|nr:hypothetical protein TrAFT101_000481 [Trichoderma asperellum]